jgi:prefoldin subunit 5
VLLKELECKPVPQSLPLDLGDGFEVDFQPFKEDSLLISVGFGFFCEMTRGEACAFLPRKREQLKRLLGRREAKIQVIRKHLETTERVINELESFK